MKERFLVAALSTVLTTISTTPLVYAQSANLTGQWQFVRNGKHGTALLALRQSGQSVTGKWMPARGAASPLENGKIAGDTLTFSFIHDKSHCNATGYLSGDSISFNVIQMKQNGKTKTIHGRAIRWFMQ